MEGFEPPIPCSQSRCDSQTSLHLVKTGQRGAFREPDLLSPRQMLFHLSYTLMVDSTGLEPATRGASNRRSTLELRVQNYVLLVIISRQCRSFQNLFHLIWCDANWTMTITETATTWVLRASISLLRVDPYLHLSPNILPKPSRPANCFQRAVRLHLLPGATASLQHSKERRLPEEAVGHFSQSISIEQVCFKSSDKSNALGSFDELPH